jgi:hypothetical protein
LLILLIASFFLQVMYTGNFNRPSAMGLMVMANKRGDFHFVRRFNGGVHRLFTQQLPREPLFMQGTWSLVI